MQLSSLLIVMTPEAYDSVLESIANMPGHSVHHLDEAQHRAIIVIEADTEAGLCAQFEALERFPGILSVSLINHILDDEEE